MLRFDESFSCFEANAKIVNSTPNASVQIPSTKYRLKKAITSKLNIMFIAKIAKHIRLQRNQDINLNVMRALQ